MSFFPVGHDLRPRDLAGPEGFSFTHILAKKGEEMGNAEFERRVRSMLDEFGKENEDGNVFTFVAALGSSGYQSWADPDKCDLVHLADGEDLNDYGNDPAARAMLAMGVCNAMMSWFRRQGDDELALAFHALDDKVGKMLIERDPL